MAALPSDDGPLVGPRNIKGTVSFSLMETGGNASVEIFINLGNNSRLDAAGFRPFAVIGDSDLAVVEELYSGYGELNETDVCPDPTKQLCHGPKLNKILQNGNVYLQANFPKMSKISKAYLKTSEGLS